MEFSQAESVKRATAGQALHVEFDVLSAEGWDDLLQALDHLAYGCSDAVRDSLPNELDGVNDVGMKERGQD